MNEFNQQGFVPQYENKPKKKKSSVVPIVIGLIIIVVMLCFWGLVFIGYLAEKSESAEYVSKGYDLESDWDDDDWEEYTSKSEEEDGEEFTFEDYLAELNMAGRTIYSYPGEINPNSRWEFYEDGTAKLVNDENNYLIVDYVAKYDADAIIYISSDLKEYGVPYTAQIDLCKEHMTGDDAASHYIAIHFTNLRWYTDGKPNTSVYVEPALIYAGFIYEDYDDLENYYLLASIEDGKPFPMAELED